MSRSTRPRNGPLRAVVALVSALLAAIPLLVGSIGRRAPRTGRWRKAGAHLAVAVLVVAGGGVVVGAPPAVAVAEPFTLTTFAPSYVTQGNTITYRLTVRNLTAQTYTAVEVFSPLANDTTYVSGGVENGGVELTIPTLTGYAVATVSFVARASMSVPVGTLLGAANPQIYGYTLGGTTTYPNPPIYSDLGLATTVEAPGTLIAAFRNSSGRAFDVTRDGYSFQNFTNTPPRVYTDDLGPRDMFELFGPVACQSGTTAATCVLTGPAKKWMQAQLEDMGFGHCDGLATSSLRFFQGLPFRGPGTPGSFQPGATTTNQLSLTQGIENYIARYMQPQSLDPAYGAQIVLPPTQTVARLTADFNGPNPVPYTIAFYKPGFKDGHSVTAIGVERVDPGESRILIYDNNFPDQREYITVNTAADTWRYVTADDPSYPPSVYEGTAATETLILNPTRARDLPAGQYFDAPFVQDQFAAAGVDSAGPELTIAYVGEGSMLVTDDQGRASGVDPDSGETRDEIPGDRLTYYNGGLHKDVPPKIAIPVDPDDDDVYYDVTLHGKTGDDPTQGSLTITGPGYTIGVTDVDLDPGETFDFSFRPNGTNIAYTSSEPSAIAPDMYISYDPVTDEDASLVFNLADVIVDSGETIFLDLDPEAQQIAFEDTSGLGQDFQVDMELIYPDGTDDHFVREIEVPVGNTRAFVDFGAWDGLKDPAVYVDDDLQNPGANHRLKLVGSTSAYNATPVPGGPAGTNTVTATFTDVTEVSLDDLHFRVANIGAGNVVLDAVGGPSGVGAEIGVPSASLGGDGVLNQNESFTVTFTVGLASAAPSNITLDAFGTPNDWAQTDPEPTYDAPDTSYVLSLDATGPAKTVSVSAGNRQSADVGTAFGTPLAAKVTDAAGKVKPGVPVTFTVTSGSAAFPGAASTVAVTSGANGIATAPPLTAGGTPGPVSVTASAPGTNAVTFRLTVTAVADLAITITGPAAAANNTTFTETVTVRNNGPSTASYNVTAVPVPAGVTFVSAPGAAIVRIGSAAFVVWTARPIANGATVTYTATFRVDPTTHATATVHAGAVAVTKDPNLGNNAAATAIRLG